jgi:hypothetical protein
MIRCISDNGNVEIIAAGGNYLKTDLKGNWDDAEKILRGNMLRRILEYQERVNDALDKGIRVPLTLIVQEQRTMRKFLGQLDWSVFCSKQSLQPFHQNHYESECVRYPPARFMLTFHHSCLLKFPYNPRPLPNAPLLAATDLTEVPPSACADGVGAAKSIRKWTALEV